MLKDTIGPNHRVIGQKANPAAGIEAAHARLKPIGSQITREMKGLR
jgi:hypothetical protein